MLDGPCGSKYDNCSNGYSSLPVRQLQSSLEVFNQQIIPQRLAELGAGESSSSQQRLSPNLERPNNALPPSERSSYPHNAVHSRELEEDVDPSAYYDDSSCHTTKQLSTRSRRDDFARGRQLHPAGRPEVLPSLRPESYTVTEAFPNVFINNTFEESITDFSRTNRYLFWYRDRPRRWIRLSISVTISVESRLWITARAPATPAISTEGLPGNLAGLLEEYLRHRADLKQDMHLQAYFGGRMDSTLGTQLRVAEPPFQTTAYLREISSSLRHLCRQFYPETALTQIPLHRCRSNCLYVSAVESVWALDFRFGSTKAEIDTSLYHLKALHCLGTTPGVCTFMGLVTDHEDGLVKGFLAKVPLKGPMFRQIALANGSGKAISWKRREKWCRQITEALAGVHSKGFAVGRLATEHRWPIALDEYDNALILWLTPSFMASRMQGTMPPEQRPLTPLEHSLPSTCYTDLYQLGLLLWRIAENVAQCGIPWCRLAGCMAEKGECHEPHSEPVQLPPTGPDIPDYVDKVISACREENPHRRPPAAELLELFPAESVESEGPGGTSRGKRPQGAAATAPPSSTQQLKEIVEMYGNIYNCDVCSNICSEKVYHCLVCCAGDYDLCVDCFSIGKHCLDPGHYLQEMLWIVQDHEYFYSSVQEDGQRIVASGLGKQSMQE